MPPMGYRRFAAFEVPGTPLAWGRSRTKDGKHYISTEQRSYRATVAHCAIAAFVRLIEGPVYLTVRAFWPMKGPPLKRGRRPGTVKTTRPDLDNVVKQVCDALNGVAWLDDAQVVRVAASKWHAAQGESARLEVEIEEGE